MILFSKPQFWVNLCNCDVRVYRRIIDWILEGQSFGENSSPSYVNINIMIKNDEKNDRDRLKMTF